MRKMTAPYDTTDWRGACVGGRVEVLTQVSDGDAGKSWILSCGWLNAGIGILCVDDLVRSIGYVNTRS